MFTPRQITENFAAMGIMMPEDFVSAAQHGFATIVSFLPDDEVAGALSAAQSKRLAAQHGLAFVHVPVAKFDLFTDDAVCRTRDILNEERGPVLAACSTGQRAAIVWAAASARSRPVDDVLGELHRAGFNLGFIRDDLETQADRQRWIQNAPEPRAAA